MADRQLTIAVFNEASQWRLPDSLVDRVRQAAPDVETVTVTNRRDLSEVLPQTNYLIGQPPTDDEMLSRSGQLEWIQLTGAVGGFELSLFPALRSGVRVCTSATIRAPQVAEHAMALTLALLRQLHLTIEAKLEQRWIGAQIAPKVRTLRGTTVGIISMGPIGREIARRMRVFGAHIIATVRAALDDDDVADEVLPDQQTSELMARSEVIIVSAPRTPQTEGMIGRTLLGRMKPSAILIDVSRGGIVQQGPLIDVLLKNRIAGAGLDVFESEPLPPDSPLWTMPNVILTPHVSSACPLYWKRATDIICENLTRLRERRPLIDEVPPEWYQRTTRR